MNVINSSNNNGINQVICNPDLSHYIFTFIGEGDSYNHILGYLRVNKLWMYVGSLYFSQIAKRMQTYLPKNFVAEFNAEVSKKYNMNISVIMTHLKTLCSYYNHNLLPTFTPSYDIFSCPYLHKFVSLSNHDYVRPHMYGNVCWDLMYINNTVSELSLTNIGFFNIERINTCPYLEYLSITNCDIKDGNKFIRNPEIMTLNVSSASNLKVLRFKNNTLEYQFKYYNICIAYHPELIILDLYTCVVIFTELLNLTHLKTIILEKCKILFNSNHIPRYNSLQSADHSAETFHLPTLKSDSPNLKSELSNLEYPTNIETLFLLDDSLENDYNFTQLFPKCSFPKLKKLACSTHVLKTIIQYTQNLTYLLCYVYDLNIMDMVQSTMIDTLYLHIITNDDYFCIFRKHINAFIRKNINTLTKFKILFVSDKYDYIPGSLGYLGFDLNIFKTIKLYQFEIACSLTKFQLSQINSDIRILKFQDLNVDLSGDDENIFRRIHKIFFHFTHLEIIKFSVYDVLNIQAGAYAKLKCIVQELTKMTYLKKITISVKFHINLELLNLALNRFSLVSLRWNTHKNGNHMYKYTWKNHLIYDK